MFVKATFFRRLADLCFCLLVRSRPLGLEIDLIWPLTACQRLLGYEL
ncbi:hypothetical protein EDE11_12268 [Methylomonas methanica]|uniref:Uncharacterized protein n=1 Tax=Methylomonas methanica TaxID=421 RepID=A0ABY2CIV7_METMH|nr:hypothetical protein EDE11_12268 [Methylomonas methanica]